MDRDLKNIKEIDDYLSGELSLEHKIEFEKRLKEDTSIQEALNTAKKVIEGVHGAGFRNMLKDLHSKLFPDKS
jgi:hypothetical protein